MKIWVVYRWDRWNHTEYGRKYFLDQDRAMRYYEGNKENDLDGSWDWDEIKTED